MVRTISDTYFTVHSSSDMLFSGVLLCSSKHATQHGDGLALISYWKNSLGTYHETSKVRNKKKLFPPPENQIFIITPIFLDILQFCFSIPAQPSICLILHVYLKVKYRRCAHMKIASANGVLGEKVQVDSTFNSLVNDQGRIITNILIDIIVTQQHNLTMG